MHIISAHRCCEPSAAVSWETDPVGRDGQYLAFETVCARLVTGKGCEKENRIAMVCAFVTCSGRDAGIESLSEYGVTLR